MTVKHDYHTLEERAEITRLIDEKFGLDYEITDNDDGAGSIVIFEMSPGEYTVLMAWLTQKGFV
jgi:hypothetical protein